MSDHTADRSFRFSDVALDLDRGLLTRGGAPVPLRAKAWALLAHLARDPGRVVPKDELLAAVWPGVLVTEDSLTQAVREVRRAIGDPNGAILRTAHRRGYALDLPERGPVDRAPAEIRVAVFPFETDDLAPDDALLVAGFAEELTDALARFPPVASLAARPAARPATNPADAAARLGAAFHVTGTARRAGERIRLAVALTETDGARRIWGERIDAAPEEIFAAQADLTSRIVLCIVRGVEIEAATGAREPPLRLSALQNFLRGRTLLRSYEPGANERALAHFAAAEAEEPGWGLALAYRALASMAVGGYGHAPRSTLTAARDAAARAVELAPQDARCHRALAYARSFLDEYAAAEDAARRAMTLNPCDAETVYALGDMMLARGRPAEALAHFDRAAGLDPLHPEYLHIGRSLALYLLGRYAESAEELARVPRLNFRTELRMAATLALAGRTTEAARHLDRAESLGPGRPLLDAADLYRLERPEDVERIRDGIRAALAARMGRTG